MRASRAPTWSGARVLLLGLFAPGWSLAYTSTRVDPATGRDRAALRSLGSRS